MIKDLMNYGDLMELSDKEEERKKNEGESEQTKIKVNKATNQVISNVIATK